MPTGGAILGFDLSIGQVIGILVNCYQTAGFKIQDIGDSNPRKDRKANSHWKIVDWFDMCHRSKFLGD